MSTAPGKKPRRRTNNPQHQNQQQNTSHPADDTLQNTYASYINASNDDLNLSVLRRYWPDVFTVIHTSSYAVLYLFSPHSQTWEKVGIEGTLFVTFHRNIYQLPGSEGEEERFSVTILNRRGMDNFSAPLTTPDDVDVTDSYIIIKEADDIFGLWIFSEPPPSSTAHARETTAQVILECSKRAQASREALLQQAGLAAEEEEENFVHGAPMGRTMSLRDMLGEQRVQDAGFSVHEHHTPPHATQAFEQHGQNSLLPKPSMFQKNADTEFFHSGSTPVMSSNLKPTQPKSNQGGISISVDDLFARAGKTS
jgi:Dcp1-like decapping family